MDNTNNKTVVDNKASSVGAPSPVGLSQKEQVPIISKDSAPSEFITPSEPELNLPKEVAGTGIEVVSDRPPLTKTHEAAGIQPPKESTLVATQPSGLVHIPEIDEIKKGLQISPAYSARWLAELGRKVLKGLGLWKGK